MIDQDRCWRETCAAPSNRLTSETSVFRRNSFAYLSLENEDGRDTNHCTATAGQLACQVSSAIHARLQLMVMQTRATRTISKKPEKIHERSFRGPLFLKYSLPKTSLISLGQIVFFLAASFLHPLHLARRTAVRLLLHKHMSINMRLCKRLLPLPSFNVPSVKKNLISHALRSSAT